MPVNVWVAIGVMLGISLGIFLAIVRCRNPAAARWPMVVGVVGAVGLVVHAVVLNDNITITRLLPLANVGVWGNWTPIFTALLAGAAWLKMRGPAWQRVLACAALFAVCVYMAYFHLLGSPPALRPDRWTNGVCRQSTTSTCSAAAAATLLAAHGIQTNEAEMARLCLTRDRGTTSFGIYRGLKVKSCRKVEVLDVSLDDLLARHEPAMISIGLANNDPGGIGLPIGNSHSIVVFGVNPDGTIDVGDPFSGRQAWSREQLRKVWHSEAFVVR
jgi:hypothetical protein